MESKLSGLDSLLSMVQMPAGVPVGTLAVGKAGAVNGAILAASIVAEAQLALRRERPGEEYRAGFEDVLASASRMQRTLDALLAAARAEASQGST